MHASYLLGKSFKFPFLGQDDYEIGPCVTRVDCRGRGLYPDVLRFICHNVGGPKSKFYMLVAPSNTASIRGIEKAGFSQVGYVKRSKYLRRWGVYEQG